MITRERLVSRATGTASAAVAAALVLTGVGAAASADEPVGPPVPLVVAGPAGTCPSQLTTPEYDASVRAALDSKRDLWGEQLLAEPGGPTYEAASTFLPPLLYGQQRQYRPLTPSGVYYLAFSYPPSAYSPPLYSLHVADGSEIVTRKVGDGSLAIDVGPRGLDHYGACPAWLTPAKLADGYLPILQTAYVDRDGVRYREESFLGRAGSRHKPVAFVKVEVDATGSPFGAVVALRPKLKRQLAVQSDRLEAPQGTRLIVSAGGRYDGHAFRFVVPPGQTAVVYGLWVIGPSHDYGSAVADQAPYEDARADVTRFWQRRLAAGAAISVPEERVQNALRAILIQQMGHTWRYSLGNPYEELSFAEGTGNAEVMSEYGYGDVAQAIVRFSLTRLPKRYTSWRAGAQLEAQAVTYELSGDRRLLEQSTPGLTWALRELEAHQIRSGPAAGRLLPEALSSDQSAPVDNVTSQLVAWQGLRAMARVWTATAHRRLALRATVLADRLEAALRRAVPRAIVTMSDGSLFLPYSLANGTRPFDQISASRLGSYWNLVVPYAFASGFFRPGSPDARGLVEYMLAHGSRMLGVPRADAHIVYPNAAEGRTFGLGQIYGLSSSRFLADNDDPDQLVLSLYGMMAAGMTPDTFVSGEAVSVLPLGRAYYRKMYMPPNSGANGAFLETLRLMLVHERRGLEGEPTGVDLAFSTPRAWLADGKQFSVAGAPMSLGRVSFTVARQGPAIVSHVSVPATLRVRATATAPAPACGRDAHRRPRRLHFRPVRFRRDDRPLGPRHQSGRLRDRRGAAHRPDRGGPAVSHRDPYGRERRRPSGCEAPALERRCLMAYKALDAAEIKPTWGTFKMVRHELGGTAFGLNQIDFPPEKVGSEHDEAQSGQEEIYYTLAGSGTLTIDGEDVEMRPGRYILVSPDARRRPTAGADGLSFICVGGVPGGVYEPWAPPDE